MTDLESAKANLKNHSICLCKNGEWFTGDGRGISPMMKLIGEGRNLSGFSAADVIVGKAAAMLFVKAGIVAVHGVVMSQSGKAFLEKSGVFCSFDTLTGKIVNRKGDGICPMEQAVDGIEDVEEGYQALAQRLKEMKPPSRGDRARQLFEEGYNCSQAVLLAFEDMTGLERETAARLASSFGGGLARMREVCGAVSGGAMVLGLLRGYADSKDYEAKKAHYALVQEFARRFREQNGSIVCRELLSGTNSVRGDVPEKRTETYYKKRPCPALVKQAADILEGMLTNSSI